MRDTAASSRAFPLPCDGRRRVILLPENIPLGCTRSNRKADTEDEDQSRDTAICGRWRIIADRHLEFARNKMLSPTTHRITSVRSKEASRGMTCSKILCPYMSIATWRSMGRCARPFLPPSCAAVISGRNHGPGPSGLSAAHLQSGGSRDRDPHARRSYRGQLGQQADPGPSRLPREHCSSLAISWVNRGFRGWAGHGRRQRGLFVAMLFGIAPVPSPAGLASHRPPLASTGGHGGEGKIQPLH
jgi:hypothetical protein